MRKLLRTAVSGFFLFLSIISQALDMSSLNQIPVIRVEMPKTAGLGHQSVAIHFIKRIRQLGYTGKIQLLTGSSSLNALKSLVIDPIPEVSPKPLQSQLRSLNVELLVSPTPEFNPDDFKLEPVELSVIAATDRAFKPSDHRAQKSLVLQPTEWIGKDPRIVNEDGSETLFPELWKVAYDNYPAQVENPKAFIDAQLQNDENPHKSQVLNAIFSSGADLLMSYDNMNYGSRLENVIAGLNSAITKEAELFAKPIIITSLTDNPGENKLQYDFKKKFPKMKIISSSDPEAAQKISRLAPGEIAYVHVGNLPQDLFHYALTRSTLPALVTGSNTTTLLKKTGNLFFSTAKDAKQFPDIQSKENADFYKSLSPWSHAGIPIQDVEKVILESRNPTSTVLRDYQDNAAALRNAGDRVDELLSLYLSTSRTTTKRSAAGCKGKLE